MSKRSYDKQIKITGYVLMAFGIPNVLILLFYLYAYLFDHTLPAHPTALWGVAGVATLSIFLSCIMISVDGWYSRRKDLND